MKKKYLVNIVAIVFTSSFLLTACGGDSDYVDVVDDTTSISDTSAETDINDDSSSPSTELSSEEVAGLLLMREEEELARNLYLDIYEAKDNNRLTVFKNISDKAETKHAEAVRVLLVKYGIDDPSTGERNTYTDATLQALYDQLLNIALGSDDLAALRVGALVEETDIGDLITREESVTTEHADIMATYENLLCGSRNHLRSFVGQIEAITGKTYITQIPALDSEVRDILNTDKENCGQ